MTEIIVLPCLPLQQFFHRPWQPQVTTNPKRTSAAKGYRGMLQFLPTSLNRSHLALSHLTFKYSGKFQACDRGAWIYFMSFRNVSLFPVGVLLRLLWGCVSNLNAEQETSAQSQEDSSLCHFLYRTASNPALLLTKWEGGGEKKIKKQQILMRCYTEK